MKFIIYKFGKKGKYASYKDVPDYVEWVPIGFLNATFYNYMFSLNFNQFDVLEEFLY